MKVIFLDCDGVLNSSMSKSRCGDYIGIDTDKVKRLKTIVDTTGAEIILSSTWRLGFNKDGQQLEEHAAKYLQNKLGKQHLRIVGMTPNFGRMGGLRGHEIHEWLSKNDDVVEEWVVLDDEWFPDFAECGIAPHLVQTEWDTPDGGLQDKHVKKAVEILGGV